MSHIIKSGDSWRWMGKAVTRTKEGVTTTEVIASTASVDRQDDILEQDWKLDHFQKNPVILFNHFPFFGVVGRATEVGLVDGALRASIQWDDNPDNPLGTRVARQYREGFLNAVSVGFKPKQVIARRDLADDDPKHGERGYWLSRNELLEISAVPVPANAEALSKAFEAAGPMRTMAQALIKSTLLDLLKSDADVRAVLEATLDPLDEPVPDWVSGLQERGADWFAGLPS